jgi:hypothetical protein
LAAISAAATLIGCAGGTPPQAHTISYATGGTVQLAPPDTLTVRFDAAAWAFHTGSDEGWGGDASLAWADTECADLGGTPEWRAGVEMDCTNVDY